MDERQISLITTDQRTPIWRSKTDYARTTTTAQLQQSPQPEQSKATNNHQNHNHNNQDNQKFYQEDTLTTNTTTKKVLCFCHGHWLALLDYLKKCAKSCWIILRGWKVIIEVK